MDSFLPFAVAGVVAAPLSNVSQEWRGNQELGSERFFDFRSHLHGRRLHSRRREEDEAEQQRRARWNNNLFERKLWEFRKMAILERIHLRRSNGIQMMFNHFKRSRTFEGAHSNVIHAHNFPAQSVPLRVGDDCSPDRERGKKPKWGNSLQDIFRWFCVLS